MCQQHDIGTCPRATYLLITYASSDPESCSLDTACECATHLLLGSVMYLAWATLLLVFFRVFLGARQPFHLFLVGASLRLRWLVPSAAHVRISHKSSIPHFSPIHIWPVSVRVIAERHAEIQETVHVCCQLAICEFPMVFIPIPINCVGLLGGVFLPKWILVVQAFLIGVVHSVCSVWARAHPLDFQRSGT